MTENSDQPRTEYQYDWQNPNLKKFDFGRMMSRTFRGALYCAKQFWLPVGLVLGIPTFLISLWPMLLPNGVYGEFITGGGFDGFEGAFTPFIIVMTILIYLAFIAVTAILYIALSHNIYGFYNESAPSFRESWRRGVSRIWVTIGSSILFLMGAILGLIIFIIPGLLLVLGWYLITPIIAMEQKGPIDSLARSWNLSSGSKRWILLFFIVLVVISLIIQTVFSLIALPFGNQTLALLEGGTTMFWILYAIGAALSQIVILFLTVAGLTSIYYEIRDLKEGVGQERLSAVFD